MKKANKAAEGLAADKVCAFELLAPTSAACSPLFKAMRGEADGGESSFSAFLAGIDAANKAVDMPPLTAENRAMLRLEFDYANARTFDDKDITRALLWSFKPEYNAELSKSYARWKAARKAAGKTLRDYVDFARSRVAELVQPPSAADAAEAAEVQAKAAAYDARQVLRKLDKSGGGAAELAEASLVLAAAKARVALAHHDVLVVRHQDDAQRARAELAVAQSAAAAQSAPAALRAARAALVQAQLRWVHVSARETRLLAQRAELKRDADAADVRVRDARAQARRRAAAAAAARPAFGARALQALLAPAPAPAQAPGQDLGPWEHVPLSQSHPLVGPVLKKLRMGVPAETPALAADLAKAGAPAFLTVAVLQRLVKMAQGNEDAEVLVPSHGPFKPADVVLRDRITLDTVPALEALGGGGSRNRSRSRSKSRSQSQSRSGRARSAARRRVRQ